MDAEIELIDDRLADNEEVLRMGDFDTGFLLVFVDFLVFRVPDVLQILFGRFCPGPANCPHRHLKAAFGAMLDEFALEFRLCRPLPNREHRIREQVN